MMSFRAIARNPYTDSYAFHQRMYRFLPLVEMTFKRDLQILLQIPLTFTNDLEIAGSAIDNG